MHFAGEVWTLLESVRTLAEIPVEFPVFVDEPSLYEMIATKARELRTLGMSRVSIGKVLGVTDKTAKKAARLALRRRVKAGV